MAAKSRPFTIYLLKTDYTPDNALRADHRLRVAEAHELPDTAQLYVLDAPPRPPWWRDYFGIPDDLKQEQKGALVFIRARDRWFALSFGQVQSHLDDHSYEYDFGLRVTLNCLNPEKVKSADMVDPGIARRKRTQVPSSTELTYLDFNGNSEILKSLTGSVKDEHRELFRNATGSVGLKVTLKRRPAELPDLCEKLHSLYNDTSYKDAFPNIQNISPTKDPSIIDDLDMRLQEMFRGRDEEITLNIPDIIDYRDHTCCQFEAGGEESYVFPDISIEPLYDFLEDNNILETANIDDLRNYRMRLTDPDGFSVKSYNIYRSILCDIERPNDDIVYHLCEGSWYAIERKYLNEIDKLIDERCVESPFHPYQHDRLVKGKPVYSEENYNKSISEANSEYICLDQTSMAPHPSGNVEPCDIYSIRSSDGDASRALFYHLKISTRSAQLSHLFNQGANGVHLLKAQQEYRTALAGLLESRIGDNSIDSYTKPIKEKKYEVIFGVITHKESHFRSKNLPIFSRISLMRAIVDMDVMDVPSFITFIRDNSPHKAGYSRNTKLVVHVVDQGGGKLDVRPVSGQNFDENRSVSGCPRALKEGPLGMRYEIYVREKPDGALYTYHKWPWSKIPQ